MTKELTPLEALKILKEANTIYCDCASNLFARYRFEIETIETALKELQFYKLRYESKCRLVDKIQCITLIAYKYIAKENLPKWRKENLEYLQSYGISLKDELDKLAKEYETN